MVRMIGEGRDDVGRVRVKREMQFISMTQKLLEGGEPALVRIGLSVYLGQRRSCSYCGEALFYI